MGAQSSREAGSPALLNLSILLRPSGRLVLLLPPDIDILRPRAACASPSISVIIPAFNEAGRIGPYLEAIAHYFAGRDESYELWVVDDGSDDDTAALVRTRAEHDAHLGLLRYPRNRGKGYAVRAGMQMARGALRLFADADGSTPIAEIERLRRAIEARGVDVAIGSRALASDEVVRVVKSHRRIIGECFRLLRRAVLHTDILDSQCGFKLFTATAARRLFAAAQLDGFAFDVELLSLAARAGMRVEEVAVNWSDTPRSRVNLLVDPARMLRDTLRVRRLHRDTRLMTRAEAERAEAARSDLSIDHAAGGDGSDATPTR